MRNTLFENIVDNQKGIQTIVIENEIPEINYKDANIIHFTKEKNNGRYGCEYYGYFYTTCPD